jgi:hypothetical protein
MKDLHCKRNTSSAAKVVDGTKLDFELFVRFKSTLHVTLPHTRKLLVQPATPVHAVTPIYLTHPGNLKMQRT